MSPANSRTETWQNPLRDKRDKRLPRIAGPCAVVIFGVTGDLARKKVVPAIYDLANRGLLPPTFSLVGFGRRDWDDEAFSNEVHQLVKDHSRTPFRPVIWDRLAEGCRFVQGAFDDDEAFARLAETLDKLDAERGTSGNHAFYLAIPPKSFPAVCEQLDAAGLASIDADMRQSIAELADGSVDITLLADRWVRSNPGVRITWLENWITQRVHASLGSATSHQSAEPVRLPAALLKPKIRALFELLDAARDVRRLASTGMNQQLALEALLVGGRTALSK